MKTKILVLVGIAVCVMLVTSPALASAGYSKIYGNANEDDVLDMRDVTYIKLVIFGKKSATTLADANNDCKISMLDVGQTKLIILDKEKKLTLIDQADRIVTVPRPIERIVTSNPDPARLIIAFGEGDKLVGLPKYGKFCLCYKGPEVAPICTAGVCGGRLFELPDVGEHRITNIELTVALKPDVIFSTGSSGEADDVMQEKTGIPVVNIKSGGGHKFEEIYEAAELMGTVLKREEDAQKLISLVEEKIDKVRDVTSEIPDDEKPKVYFAARGVDPDTYGGSITRTTNFYEPLNIAGGINVAKDCGTGAWGEVDVSKEQIIAWNPHIILVSPHGLGKAFGDVEAILSDPDLQTVDAVKNHRVYFSVYPFCCGTPQDRNLANMMYLAKLFHPEEFADLDVEEEGNEIYEGFLGVDGLFSEYADTTVWLREWFDSQ
jgi:iron complex transport system substrate-binding protein